jgi:hypothetical protein
VPPPVIIFYDIAWKRLGGAAPAHTKEVARPHGRRLEHSITADLNWRFSSFDCPQVLKSAITNRLRAGSRRAYLPVWVVGGSQAGSYYDALRLCAHADWVVLTLPQDSAEVSKTRSCLNAGLWYGFLPLGDCVAVGVSSCFIENSLPGKSSGVYCSPLCVILEAQTAAPPVQALTPLSESN